MPVAAVVAAEQKVEMPVAAVVLVASVAAVPLSHPLHAPTPENYLQPTGRRASSDDDGDNASAYTSRTQRSASSKSTSVKLEFPYFVVRYAEYDDDKKAAKLKEETGKIHADILMFVAQLKKEAGKLSHHAQERIGYQQACLRQPESDDAQESGRLEAAGKRLQQEEEEWKLFFKSSKVLNAGNRL